MAKQKPRNVTPPVVSGTAAVGATLSSSKGTWQNVAGASYAYRWTSNGAPITGATSATYTVRDADAGDDLRCQVTATNAQGSTTASSNSVSIPAAPVDPPPDPGGGGGTDPGTIDRSTQIKVGWRANPKGKATTVFVDVAQDWEGAWTTDAGTAIGSGTSSVDGQTVISDLSPNTPYYYRVRAVSANGSSIYIDYDWTRTQPSSPGRTLHVGSGQAYATIENADAAAQPGDEIVVHGGGYGTVTMRINHPGYVWVRANAGETPVLAKLGFSGGQRVGFIGIRVDGHGLSGMPRLIETANCSHLRFFDCSSAGDPNMQGYDGGNCWAGPSSSDVHFFGHNADGSAFGVKAYSGTSTVPSGYRFYGSEMQRSTYDIGHLDQFSDFAFERCHHKAPATVTSEHHDAVQTTSGNKLRVRRCHFEWDGYKTSDGNDNGVIFSDQVVTDAIVECNLIEKWRGAGLNIGICHQSVVRNNSLIGCPGAGSGGDQDLAGWGTDFAGLQIVNNICKQIWVGSARPAAAHHNHVTSGSNNISGTGDSSGSANLNGSYQPTTGPCAHGGSREGMLWGYDGRGWGSQGQAKGCLAATDSDAPLVESMTLL